MEYVVFAIYFFLEEIGGGCDHPGQWPPSWLCPCTWQGRLAAGRGQFINRWAGIYVSVLMAIFPGEPGLELASSILAKNGGGGGDNWSYQTCKAPAKSSPPTNQHPTFHGLVALSVAQPTVSKHWRESIFFRSVYHTAENLSSFG